MTSQIGKFEIIRSIGKGAMGEVFLGRDPQLNREVAIKTIPTDSAFDEESKSSFEFEARATAALSHPNIVTIFDVGHQDGKVYLVMEYVEGDTLEALIAKGTPKQALLEAMAEVCEGLAYAHEVGLVHRDIKPSNIMVSARGKRNLVKLVDFGVATHNEGNNQPGDGKWRGTIHYMAPEYLKTGTATPSSDIFAMGVILYEILSGGRKPFNGEDTTAVLSTILSQAPPPLTPISLGGLPPALIQVVSKALEKDPLNRYQDAESLGQAILNALKTTPAGTTAAVKPEQVNILVGRGGQATCLSLRVALRQAASGAQIRVLPGVYKESILLEKDVIITGEGDPTKIIIESTGPPAIRVKSGRSIIRDITLTSTHEQIDSLVEVIEGQLTLKNCAMKTLGNCAVNVEHGAEVTMQDCITVGHGRILMSILGKADLYGGHISGATKAAISILKGGQCQLQYVRMGPGDGVGVLLSDQAKASMDSVVMNGFDEGGLELVSTASVSAKECQFTSSIYAGLIQSGQSKSRMENCQFSGHEGSGVHAAEEAEIELLDCKSSENKGYGVSVMGRGKITMNSCQISANEQAGAVVLQHGALNLNQCRIFEGLAEGVHCFSASEARLELCEIKGNAAHGTQVDSGSYVTMKQCVIHDNQGAGLQMGSNADTFLESCLIQRNASGSIAVPQDGKKPELLGNNHIDAYDA